jgi:hypothetical protein
MRTGLPYGLPLDGHRPPPASASSSHYVTHGMWSDQTCPDRQRALRHPRTGKPGGGRTRCRGTGRGVRTHFSAVARGRSRSFALFTLAKRHHTGSHRGDTERHTTAPRRRPGAGLRQTPAAVSGGDAKGIPPANRAARRPPYTGSRVRPPTQRTLATCAKCGRWTAEPDDGGRRSRLIKSIDRTGRWRLQHLAALWVIFTHDTEPSTHVQSPSVKDACVRGCQRRDAHAN